MNESTPIYQSLLTEGYQLSSVIGQGGAGVVYSAYDMEEEQQVAIKIIQSSLLDAVNARSHSHSNDSSSNSQTSRSLFKELATTTRIIHPNIVKILDFGISDLQDIYIVMELLVGQDMSHYLKTYSPLSCVECIPLFCEALDAIAHAHHQNIVHQDLKPSNLFLTHHHKKAKLIVMDFGIARKLMPHQQQDRIVGSLPYMAPEYLQHQKVSKAGDVYQLGLTLIELLVGSRVIQASSNMQIIYKHMLGNLNIEHSLKFGKFWQVLQKSITLDPQHRYQDALEFKNALQAVPVVELHEIDQRLKAQRLSVHVGQIDQSINEVIDQSSSHQQEKQQYHIDIAQAPTQHLAIPIPTQSFPLPIVNLDHQKHAQELEQLEKKYLDQIQVLHTQIETLELEYKESTEQFEKRSKTQVMLIYLLLSLYLVSCLLFIFI